ncbi:MAG TPA: VTT domain-containing protein [Thermoanaerobaculia bacterium]|nr:VTT domain-containing protein [Thermoanaerobaculia bacterium]
MTTPRSSDPARTPPPVIRLLLLGIALACASVLFFAQPERWTDLSRGIEAARSLQGHWWAPVAYLALYALFSLLLLPPILLSIAGALIWGWVGGGLMELLAATVGSVAPYAIARLSAGSWLAGLIERRSPAIGAKLREEGFMALLLLRLVPVVPYVILNYAAGIASIRPRHYLPATVLGMIPSIFVFTYFVDAIAAGIISVEHAFGRILVAGGLVAIFAVATRIVVRRVRR